MEAVVRIVRSSPLFLFALVASIVPVGAAHGDAVSHVNPVTLELAAGEERLLPIEFEEGKLRSDWVFLLNAVVTSHNGPVNIYLTDGVRELSNWSVPATGETHHLTTRIEETAFHSLVVRNTSPGAANVTFFYDTSCNCAGKPIPPDVVNGAVLFNIDARKGDRLETVIPEPLLLDLSISHAVRTNERSQWPDDFTILETSVTPAPEGEREVHRFSWTASSQERHYYWVEVLDTDRETFSRLPPEMAVLGVYVQPSTTKVEGDARATGTLIVLGVAALLVGVRRVRTT